MWYPFLSYKTLNYINKKFIDIQIKIFDKILRDRLIREVLLIWNQNSCSRGMNL